jgi:TonB-dependent receptor
MSGFSRLSSSKSRRCSSFRYGGYGLLAATASSVLALVAASPALAQDTTAQSSNGDTAQPSDATSADASGGNAIIVTGIRGALQRDLNIKRNSPGVVDAISNEDIGHFPDSNVASALSRVPGVTIQRANARGEATGITARGFSGDFNETLFDGRKISSATGGRSVDFSTVGADFIGTLSVLKTPDVTLSSSSIGATLNVEYPKPFDHPGLRVAATASGSYQPSSDRVTPTGGLLVSDTFANDTLGVLADVVYTRHDTRTNNVYVHGWPGGLFAPCQLAGSVAATCNPTTDTTAADSQIRSIPGWVEQQMGAQQQNTRDERIDGRIALQWRPSDNLLFTLDDNYSRQKIQEKDYGFGIWFNQTSLRDVSLDNNGTAVDFVQAGSQTDFNSTRNVTINRTNQIGANVKWDATSNLHFDVDAAYAKSWLNPGLDVASDNADIGYGFGPGPALGIKILGNSDKFIPELHDYGYLGDPARWADTSVMGSHVTVRTLNQNTDVLKQARFVGNWEQDNFNIQFGAHYQEDHFHFTAENTFANNFWQAYAGYGPASSPGLPPCVPPDPANPQGPCYTGVPLPASIFGGSIGTNGFIPGYHGSLPPSLLVYEVAPYQAYLGSLGNPQTTFIPGFNYPAGGAGTNFTGTFDLAPDGGSFRDITEKTFAPFVRANFDVMIGSMPFHFNAGLREEMTHVLSKGFGQLPTAITRGQGDPTLLTVTLGSATPLTAKNSYNYLLPSMDMRLEVTPTFQLRLDASRTLTRPALNFMYPQVSISTLQRVGALTASGGAPNLKPYLSDNFDAAAEWYYQRNSYVSVDFFLKHVTNFIVGGVTNQTINGVIDPSTGQPAVFHISQQVNGPEATVRGVEIALQHVFGDTGFGLQANATFVGTNKKYDPTDISQSGFAVTGLANSANFVAFYDKNGFEARAAVNWRDAYLLQFGQVQNTGAFGAEPTFVNPSTTVDFSTSYQLTPNFNVFFEALNITNETSSTHGRFKNQLLDVFRYGRRFTAGVRFRLGSTPATPPPPAALPPAPPAAAPAPAPAPAPATQTCADGSVVSVGTPCPVPPPPPVQPTGERG